MSRLTDKDWKNPESLMWTKPGLIHMRNEAYRTSLSYALRKLAHYEDLEDQLEKLYGNRLPLDKVVDNLNRVVQNGEEKLDLARILTNAEAEKWDRWKSLEDQGRLVEQRYATTCECCCSACKEDYTRVAEGESGMVWEGEYPNYCPWCGAKFVSEEELKEIEGTE